MASPQRPANNGALTTTSPHATASGSPSPSKKKLQIYEEPVAAFGTHPAGSATHKAAKIKKVCLDHIGMDAPSDEVLKELFDHFDVDHSGCLNKAEFREIYSHSFENYGAPMTEKDLDRTFEKLDKDRSGTLSYEEFCILILNRMKM